MTETSKTHAVPHAKRPFFAHAMRVLAVPIILGWIAFAVVVSTIAPSLEVVGETHSSPMAPKDAPSLKAMMLMGHNFKEFDSNSTVNIVVEGQQPLGPDAHRYYDSIIAKLNLVALPRWPGAGGAMSHTLETASAARAAWRPADRPVTREVARPPK
jgi:putative drug exporter of the RND superfamily